MTKCFEMCLPYFSVLSLVLFSQILFFHPIEKKLWSANGHWMESSSTTLRTTKGFLEVSRIYWVVLLSGQLQFVMRMQRAIPEIGFISPDRVSKDVEAILIFWSWLGTKTGKGRFNFCHPSFWSAFVGQMSVYSNIVRPCHICIYPTCSMEHFLMPSPYRPMHRISPGWCVDRRSRPRNAIFRTSWTNEPHTHLDIRVT